MALKWVRYFYSFSAIYRVLSSLSPFSSWMCTRSSLETLVRFSSFLRFLDNMANHLFSLMIILPFLATSLALYAYNSYPAQCFVGDVYTYTAGVTFAVVLLSFGFYAVGGHFWSFLQVPAPLLPSSIHQLCVQSPSSILFSLFSTTSSSRFCLFPFPVPVIAFPSSFLSTLFIARYNPQLKLLTPSVYKEEENSAPATSLDDYKPPRYINHTLINLVLYLFGPCTERQLTNRLLLLQAICSVFAFCIRIYADKHFVADLWFVSHVCVSCPFFDLLCLWRFLHSRSRTKHAKKTTISIINKINLY